MSDASTRCLDISTDKISHWRIYFSVKVETYYVKKKNDALPDMEKIDGSIGTEVVWLNSEDTELVCIGSGVCGFWCVWTLVSMYSGVNGFWCVCTLMCVDYGVYGL